MPNENTANDLSPNQVRRLPFKERHAYVEKILISYPRWNQLLDLIKELHERAKIASDPQCLLIVGPTGAGKSTLIQTYRKNFPPIYTKETIIQSVVYAKFFPPARPKNAAQAILQGFKDPRAEFGTIGGMTKRIKGFRKDCKTELIFMDELQEIYDKDKGKFMYTSTNWFKNIIKSGEEDDDGYMKGAYIAVGLEGEAEEVINLNPQLRRLFGEPEKLEPFTWDEGKPETRAAFIRFLEEIEKSLPLNGESKLNKDDLAWRCFASCRGRVGYFMPTIREAAHIALKLHKEKIELPYLAEAFQNLMGKRLGIDNPFKGDAPVAPLLPLPTKDK